MPNAEAAKSQIRGSTLLMAGRGLSVALNFLTQILTVRYLAKGDYGSLAYALAMASFFAHLSRFGMDKAISRYAAIQDERAEYGRLFGTLLFAGGLVVACGATLSIGVLALGGWIGPALVSDPLSLQLLLILIALAPIDGLDYLLQSVFATFSEPRLIVFRKYIVGPLLKLLAIVGVMVAAAEVQTLAFARLGASAVGLAIAASLLRTVLGGRDLLARFDWKRVDIRAREILGYSLPMLGSDAVLLLRGALVVFFLEYLVGSIAVADFRSVLPVARLNNVALDSFAFLFVPAVARLTAKPDDGSLNDMFWRSASWVAVLSLPVFLVTFALAEPLTVTLFGERYADAAPVLALLAAGAFLHASLAMSGLVLKAAGRVRNVLAVDAAALVLEVALIALLIPRYGAVGGASAYAATATMHALAYQLVLARRMEVRLLPVGFGRVYASIGVVAGAMLLFDRAVEPALWLGVPVVGALWLALVLVVARELQVSSTFPELMRLPVLGSLLEWAERPRSSSPGTSAGAHELVDALRCDAARLASDLGPAPHHVRLLRERIRPGSTILELDLEGPEGRLPLLVKTGTLGGDADGRAPRPIDFPRIGRREPAGVVLDAEHTTLLAVAEHLAELDDDRFEPVRVFDVGALSGSVAMERLPYPTLRDLVVRDRMRLWAPPARDLLTAAANAGAWLRAFQSLPPQTHTEPRHADRDGFVEAVGGFAEYLLSAEADGRLAEEAWRRMTAGAEALLGKDPPCALGHGDYAPRNILVSPAGRVAVIDTPGRWWFPVHLDVGYFLADLRTSFLRTLTGGRLPDERTLDEIEQAFLTGYFGSQPIQQREVRLFESFALTARWASAVHTAQLDADAGPVDRAIARLRAVTIRERLASTLESLDGTGVSRRPKALHMPRQAIGAP